MVYKNNPQRIPSQELNGYILISNFKQVIEVKSPSVFKHQATTSPQPNENQPSNTKATTPAIATPTDTARVSFRYSKLNGLIIERVLL